ncbi:hypothetical protein C0Z19_00485 [Trinickia soli]|uniref:Uncharacterized protein n=1 Tax=Trinickia soli TaxID=380675 RepID=A0A2N7WFV8_9BURK|nr:hypothetical protein CIW54_08455 [Paraburkholderia sp. T12-10]PMS28244.1 hypothetical protein C0Z19_00485 [Trinickia soli]
MTRGKKWRAGRRNGHGPADLLVVDKPPKAARERTPSTHEPKNYTVDISALARLIEEGEI